MQSSSLVKCLLPWALSNKTCTKRNQLVRKGLDTLITNLKHVNQVHSHISIQMLYSDKASKLSGVIIGKKKFIDTSDIKSQTKETKSF